MKKIKLLPILITVLMLSGCSVNPSEDLSTDKDEPNSVVDSSIHLDSSTNKDTTTTVSSSPMESSSSKEDSSTTNIESSGSKISTPSVDPSVSDSSIELESSTPSVDPSASDSSRELESSTPSADPSASDSSSELESSTPSVDPSVSDSSSELESSTPSVDPYNGYEPKRSSDGRTIEYGYYPQSYVSDSTLIASLNALESPTNGWYELDGSFYVKEVAKIYNNETYSFTDGTSIINGNTYWFKCEPITWKILEINDGNYYLLSNLILDAQSYYKDYLDRTIEGVKVFANNYIHSDINLWLNSTFYENAFSFNNYFIKQSNVSLPSYNDLINSNYGFDDNTSTLSTLRQCKVTDYAIAKGVWYNTTTSLKYNGTYWSSTASNDYFYCVWVANSGGYLTEYSVDSANNGVRPVITITL